MKFASPHRKRRANRGGQKTEYVMVTREDLDGNIVPTLCPDTQANRIAGKFGFIHDSPEDMTRLRSVTAHQVLFNAPNVLDVRKVLRKIGRQIPQAKVVVRDSQWDGMISIKVESHAAEVLSFIQRGEFGRLFELVEAFCGEGKAPLPHEQRRLHGQRYVKAGFHTNGTRCM